ncbi:hypothetical protein [Streptomyces sp. H27-S2]|uniref:hypothetical protein n=1 Tax=Streptomyces antarcticus TaxID=2996458 RepID=UPI00226EDC37|nr:hypothetical protein [Streptomyces sp. H27-S2]MCY0949819.1 hypothetical protein [Streptomyces sp. H27-S2]
MAPFRTSLSPGGRAGCLSLFVVPLLFTAVSTARADPQPPAPPSADTIAASPCDLVRPAAGFVCVPAPKQCFTAPCPQYDIVPAVPGPVTEPEATAPGATVPVATVPVATVPVATEPARAEPVATAPAGAAPAR